MKINYKAVGAAIGAIALLAAAVPAFAQTSQTGQQDSQGSWQGRGPGMMNGKPGMAGAHPGVFGLVTAVNGNTITVGSHGFGATAATTTYTVNAANATVLKNNATSTVSAIAVGDRIVVQGTVTGTNVVATTIRDGVMAYGRGPGMMGAPGNSDKQSDKTGDKNGKTPTPIIVGNGQPVVAGTVSVVNGASLTITTSSNVTYSINAASATVNKKGVVSTVSSIAVGDYVVVQGTVNGTSVTASSVIDQPAPSAKSGFFGGIGNFFKHLFGF